MNRRDFTKMSLLGFIPFSLLGCRTNNQPRSPQQIEPNQDLQVGPLQVDPNGVIDLPKGFSGIIIQTSGDTMSDGFPMPGQPDGMTCHIDKDGNYVLLRNHELATKSWCKRRGIAEELYKDDIPNKYRPTLQGGVSRVVIDQQKLQRAFAGDSQSPILSSNMVLAGTYFNCAGGWVKDGWITCEETDEPDHGYAFHTKVDDAEIVDPTARRIDNWGRLKREGVSIDTDTGIVYMTEDHQDGCLYRFVSADPENIYGPGKVQAMVLAEQQNTDPKAPLAEKQTFATTWVDIDDPSASQKTCRQQGAERGASKFTRVEGSVWDGQYLWFIASCGGPLGAGQIWRYDPQAQKTMLFTQVTDRKVLSMPDNVTLTPWGDLLVAEDNYNAEGGITHQHLRIISRTGKIHDFARNPQNNAVGSSKAPGGEFTGVCFSPDNKVLFVNIQYPRHITVAVTGPWTDLV